MIMHLTSQQGIADKMFLHVSKSFNTSFVEQLNPFHLPFCWPYKTGSQFPLSNLPVAKWEEVLCNSAVGGKVFAQT